MSFKTELVVAARMTAVTLVLTGLVYPLAVTAVAKGIFPAQAAGSLIAGADGQVVGSEWIGQGFSKPEYFWPRPSAAGSSGYDATASSGSNLGPTSQKLMDRTTADLERLRRENPQAQGRVPADLATASGSGLDPHISPDAARWQVARVAEARGVEPAQIESAVERRIEARSLGLLGEPRVNVLLLNVDLDRAFGKR